MAYESMRDPVGAAMDVAAEEHEKVLALEAENRDLRAALEEIETLLTAHPSNLSICLVIAHSVLATERGVQERTERGGD